MIGPRTSAIAAGVGLAAAVALAFTGGIMLGASDTRSRDDGAIRATMFRATPTCAPPARAYSRLELLFGGTGRDGDDVSEADWQGFLETEVSPRFPDGLTVLTGQGQWRNGQGRLTRERSRMLVIWHLPSAQAERHISAIRTAYRQRFAQESVLRVDGVSCVSF